MESVNEQSQSSPNEMPISSRRTLTELEAARQKLEGREKHPERMVSANSMAKEIDSPSGKHGRGCRPKRNW
jgi:hypothetical protein